MSDLDEHDQELAYQTRRANDAEAKVAELEATIARVTTLYEDWVNEAEIQRRRGTEGDRSYGYFARRLKRELEGGHSDRVAKIDELIERSSFGTPEANRFRAMTSPEEARRIVEQAKQRDEETDG